MHRSTIAIALLLAPRVCVAQAPLDSLKELATAAREARRIGADHGESIWPGYRPDTIPLSFVLPSKGDVLFGWRGTLPPGYVAIAELPGAAWRDRRALDAASTGTVLEGRRVAQVVAGTMDPALLVGTALHEAFHVFEAASRRFGRRFGEGENAMLISTYPVFDTDNESAFALEGRILAAALDAPSRSAKRELARWFVAVRRERHRRLPAEFAQFDQMSELNEGLAEYALVRALQIEVREGPATWRADAARALASRRALLRELTGSENLSLRFRFYQTGPAEALLLDALAGPSWKARIVADNSTLQDMLESTSRLDDAFVAALAAARHATNMTTLRADATARIEQLKASRRLKADSLLAGPGLRLVLAADSLPGKNFNPCGYDPQNLLQVTPTVRIQMRWWKPCAGGPTNAEFNVPSVYDETAGTVTAMIGDEREIQLSSKGQPIALRDGEALHDVRAFKLASRASWRGSRPCSSRTAPCSPRRWTASGSRLKNCSARCTGSVSPSSRKSGGPFSRRAA